MTLATPEEEARELIDAALTVAGWCVQDYRAVNLAAARGVAVREFELKRGFGTADYLLFVDGRPAGVVEAKPVGTTLTGVEIQTTRYSDGLPDWLNPWSRPLAMLYESTGKETRFTNRLDPDPRTDAETMNPHCLLLMSDSAFLRTSVEMRTKTGAGIHKINQRDLESSTITLPPLDVQIMLAAELESGFDCDGFRASNRGEPRSC